MWCMYTLLHLSDEKNTLQLILIRFRLLCCLKPMSNYRAQYSQNLS